MAARAPKVSVVVPVYDPGGDFDECVRSLLGQSLPAGELELIFVDDGSTDGTGGRLDELAARHPHVRVEHIPNSGWPGRPRNVGLGMARGDFVFFVDNDDWLDLEGLERVHAAAVRDKADIVVGKVVGHGGKRVPRELFARNLHGVRFRSAPVLLRMLTPHKLFRRALLEEHGLRFPEGVRRLEDHPFVVDAYFRARRISVVADHPVYHWVTRDPRDSASRRRLEPGPYFDNVREVLDLVEARTEPGPFRDRMLMHWYRGKMMQRVGGRALLRRDPEHQREMTEAVRGLLLERYREEMDAALPYSLRVRSGLVRAGDHDALRELARFEAQLRARARATRARGNGKHLVVRMRARLGGRAAPLLVRREGERLLWAAPEPLAAALGPERLDLTDDLAAARVQVHLRSTADGSEHVVPGRTEVVLEPARRPGTLRPVLVATAWIAPTIAAGGAPLPAGQWEVYATLDAAGFSKGRRVKWRGEPMTVTALAPGRILAGRHVPPLMTLRRRAVQRLPRRLRRGLARAGAAARR